MGNMAVKLFLVFANIVATLQSYDIELRGGYDNPCHDGHWEHYCAGNVYARNNLDVMGPVSDLFWGPEEATVVCHQLGYNYGSPICGSRFGTENNFAMGEVSCSGQESRIQDCSYKTDTWQGKAAGAECFDDPGLYGTTFAPECDSATTDPGTPWPGTTEGTNEGCPSGWFNSESVNGCFLFLYSKKVTWAEAQWECEKVGGYLAEPKNEELSDLLTSIAFVENDLANVTSWWIGLSDWSHETRWTWAHSVEDVTYTNWGPGAPATAQYNTLDCTMIALGDAFQWRDVSCLMEEANVICQREGD